MDVFKQVQNTNADSRPEPIIYGTNGYPAKMRENFALLNLYEKGSGITPNETVYMPVQAKQHCFM